MKPRRIAVIDAEQTRCEARKAEISYAELVYEPVHALLTRTGLHYDDIDTVVTCSSDFLDGRTISDMAIQEVTGSIGKSASKVSSDGSFALVYAWMRLLAGEFETCLVVAHSKCSEGHQALIENAAFDPLLQRSLGLTHLVAAAIQAQCLLNEGKFTREQFAQAAVHDLKNAARNPYAHHGGEYSVEEILASEPVCDPIRPLEIAPYSDGAACLLLVTESWLRKRAWKSEVAWVEGLGYCTENNDLGDKRLSENPALRKAAGEAYKMAGIRSPEKDLQFVEISSAFSYQTPLWLEEMGLAGRTSGQALNLSGGLMGANPGFASGLIRVCEAVRQVRERPGSRGLAHGMNGFPGQSHCVWLFRSGAAHQGDA